jgi:hypothetical protein
MVIGMLTWSRVKKPLTTEKWNLYMSSQALIYLAAALIASQGGLIAAVAPRMKTGRVFVNLIALLHFVCAGLLLWFAA